MYENQYFCKNLNIQESPSAYHPNGQIIRILLFLNPIPVHHPDIFLAVDNHMVYHADPQLFVKLCDRSIQFLQGANEVVDLCDPAHILLGGNCLFLIFLFHPAVAFHQLIKFFLVLFLIHGDPCVLHDECLYLLLQESTLFPQGCLLLQRPFPTGYQVPDFLQVFKNLIPMLQLFI